MSEKEYPIKSINMATNSLPEDEQPLIPGAELNAENIDELASQIEELNAKLEALDKTPEAAKKAMTTVGEARDFLEFLSGDADINPTQALQQGEHVLTALQNNLERLKAKSGSKEYTEVNLKEIEDVGNEVAEKVTSDLVLRIHKLNGSLGKTVGDFVGEEDFSNKQSFLGRQLSSKYENMLESIGVDVDSRLVAAIKNLVDKELADLGPINRFVKAVKEFIVTRVLKVFS